MFGTAFTSHLTRIKSKASRGGFRGESTLGLGSTMQTNIHYNEREHIVQIDRGTSHR